MVAILREIVEQGPDVSQFSIVEKPEVKNTILELGYLESERCRQRAIAAIKNGEIVAAQMGSVFGMWVDADNQVAVSKVAAVKGVNKAMSIMMPSSRLLDIVDKSQVHPTMIHLYSDAEQLSNLIGAICHFRTPVNPQFTRGYRSNGEKLIPDSILSSDGDSEVQYVHSLDPHGHKWMETWINELLNSGIRFVGVTSLNATGTAEIYDPREAIRFCRRQEQVPMLLLDSNTNPGVKGSFAIVHTGKGNYVRDGRIPMPVIDAILGINLSDKSPEAKVHKFDHYNFTEVMDRGLRFSDLRSQVLKIVYGRDAA